MRLIAGTATALNGTLCSRVTTSQAIETVILLLDLGVAFLWCELEETSALTDPVSFSAADAQRCLPCFSVVLAKYLVMEFVESEVGTLS